MFFLPKLVRKLLGINFVVTSRGHYRLLYRIAGKKLSLHNGLRNAFDSEDPRLSLKVYFDPCPVYVDGMKIDPVTLLLLQLFAPSSY